MIILLIVYILIALFQIPSLIKKKYWRELAAVSVCYVLTFIFSLLYVFNIPSIETGLRYVIEDVLHLKY